MRTGFRRDEVTTATATPRAARATPAAAPAGPPPTTMTSTARPIRRAGSISDGLARKSGIAFGLDHDGPVTTLRRQDEAQPHGVVDHAFEARDRLPPIGDAAGDIVRPGHDPAWPLRRPPAALAGTE